LDSVPWWKDCFFAFLEIYSSLAAELEESRFILELFSKKGRFTVVLAMLGWLVGMGGKKFSDILMILRLVSMYSCLGLISMLGMIL
jgi:hypothetical protein